MSGRLKLARKAEGAEESFFMVACSEDGVKFRKRIVRRG